MDIATLTYSCGHWRKQEPQRFRPGQCPNADHDPGDWPRGRLVDVTERTGEDYRWDDPGPDEMMPGCGHEVVDAAGTYDVGSGPAPGRGCER